MICAFHCFPFWRLHIIIEIWHIIRIDEHWTWNVQLDNLFLALDDISSRFHSFNIFFLHIMPSPLTTINWPRHFSRIYTRAQRCRAVILTSSLSQHAWKSRHSNWDHLSERKISTHCRRPVRTSWSIFLEISFSIQNQHPKHQNKNWFNERI